jgi:hypothetical protein
LTTAGVFEVQCNKDGDCVTGFAAGFRMVADPDLAQEIDRDCVKREVFTVQKVQHPGVTRGVRVVPLAV